MSKGDTAERSLVEFFWDQGLATLRAPGSGSIDRPSPDVVAIGSRPVKLLAIELKANPDGVATFERDEIEELEEWSDRCRATAYVGVKPDLRKSEHDGWYFLETSELHETPGGNYSLRKADHERCLSRGEL